jgi:hypothetical protein
VKVFCHVHCCAAGVIKQVQHLRVFITTTIISLWAYVWMLIVYLWWTPSEVRADKMEACFMCQVHVDCHHCIGCMHALSAAGP